MKIISWNICHRPQTWRDVAGLEADVALLQEACEPPTDIAGVVVEAEPWRTDGLANRRWRTSVVGLREGLEISRIRSRLLAEAGPDDLAVAASELSQRHG